MRLLKRRRQRRNLNHLETQIDRMIATQASEWVDAMRNPDSADRIRFAQWLKRQARHATEYLFMEAVDQALSRIDREKRHDIGALLATPSAEVIPLRGEEPSQGSTGSKRYGWLAFATAATLVVVVGLVALQAGGWRDVRTTVGEQRAILLEDGSTVHLNTQSHVQVKLSARSRDVRLVSGEALFNVQRDPSRPFRVHAGDTVIRAVGTQFNVYREQQATRVAVIEGRVEITVAAAASEPAATSQTHAPVGESATVGERSESRHATVRAAQLAAGEQARVGQDGRIQRGMLDDLEAATAWRERRLVFRDDALEEMVAQFNRYNEAPKIRLEGDLIKRRHYSGVFDANDPQSLTALLARERDMWVEIADGEIVVRLRPEGEEQAQGVGR